MLPGFFIMYPWGREWKDLQGVILGNVCNKIVTLC